MLLRLAGQIACVLLVLSIGMLVGCDSSERAATAGSAAGETLAGKLLLTGSSTLSPLANEIGKRFEQTHPGVRIDVQTGGSSRGISDAATGLADIGMSSRSLKLSESGGLTAHPVANDGVAFVVHKDNPVQSISQSDLRKIYVGEIKNWNQLGGDNAPITVINRAAGRSELDLVTRYFELRPRQIKASLIAGENQECVKRICNDLYAIVYLSIGTAEFEVAQGSSLKLLPLAGIAAGSDTVQRGEFPLSRPLVFVTQQNISPLAEAFIQFAQSEAVHDLVKEHSFVPLD